MNQHTPKLRIALVTTHPPGKGTLNEYAFHFVRAMREKDEIGEIILLVDELPDGESYHFDSEGVPVTVRPCWTFGALNNATRIVSAVRDTKPDIVYFNIQFASFGSGKVAAALGLTTPALVKAAGYPTIVLLHNIVETVDLDSAGFANNPLMGAAIRAFGTITTRLILTADFVALTIPKYVDILEKKYNVDNVFLAPHGAFETLPLPPDEPADGPKRILTFGKFGTYKKVDALIKATQQLRANGHPDVELVIAGSDSPNTPGYLENAAAQAGDLSGITFTGYVAEEDVPRMFQEASVVVFPYTSTTGSSGVLHQAGSYAKAAVLPNIGDFAELITDEGYTGEFFEPDDLDSLRGALEKVLDNDDYRKQIGRQNYVAACGLPIGDVVDWYLLHTQELLKQ